MSELPLISVVIPARNAAAHLGRCLESVQALDWPRERLEVIVVDNASTDDTVKIASAFEGVTVLAEQRRGAGLARNAGWRAAKGGLIAFTDSDCRPSPQWLQRLVPKFDNPEIGGAGGALIPDTPQTVVEEYIIAKDILSQERAMREEYVSPPFLVTANAMYRREALAQVEGFDEWLTVNGEDADLAWRIQWAGWKLDYVSEAEVVHSHRSTVRSFMRQVWSYGAGTSYLFKKHRTQLGYTRFTWWPPYLEVLKALFLIPFKLIFGKTPLERWTPMLDLLGGISFLRGKLVTSIKLRVWNI